MFLTAHGLDMMVDSLPRARTLYNEPSDLYQGRSSAQGEAAKLSPLPRGLPAAPRRLGAGVPVWNHPGKLSLALSFFLATCLPHN